MARARPPTGRTEIETRLIKRAWRDPDFRALLVADPKAAVEAELGFALPDELRVDVVEESQNRLVVVLPAARSGLAPAAVRAITGAAPRANRGAPGGVNG